MKCEVQLAADYRLVSRFQSFCLVLFDTAGSQGVFFFTPSHPSHDFLRRGSSLCLLCKAVRDKMVLVLPEVEASTCALASTSMDRVGLFVGS